MGDRCYFEITCADQDEKLLLEFLEKVDIDGLVVEGANYAFYSELEQLAQLAQLPDVPPFYYEHGSGSEYGAGCGVMMNMGHRIMDKDGNGNVVVPVTKDGVHERNLKEAQAYFDLLEKVKLYIEMREG